LLTGQCWNQHPIKQSLITAAVKHAHVLELWYYFILLLMSFSCVNTKPFMLAKEQHV
jgi:hypothetical protein